MLKTAAGDVQQVNIPALSYFFNGMTELSSLSELLDFHSLLEGAFQANPESTNPRVEKRPFLANSNERASKKNL